MTDFGPMIANPSLVILGAAAHLGIFVALIGANCLGFNLGEAASIGIIGGSRRPDGYLHHHETGSTSSSSDFRCSILLHGTDASHPAANHEDAHQL